MELVESILTKNPCYTAGKKITVKGLMLHSVGCNQPKASVFITNWNKASYTNACVHAFIDGNDGTIYQTLPWNHRGWHAGSTANNTHIGVEMCEPACIKYTSGSKFTVTDADAAKAAVQRTYEAAVELFAMLCGEYNLDPLKDGVIVSHSEGYRLGIASNHGDPEHLWKGVGLDYTMDTFRKAVYDTMHASASPVKIELPELRKGSKGGEVKVLQAMLKSYGYYSSAVDGDFGNVTYNAVMQYQQDNGLIVDGEVGEQTWTALFLKKAEPQHETPTPEPAPAPETQTPNIAIPNAMLVKLLRMYKQMLTECTALQEQVDGMKEELAKMFAACKELGEFLGATE